MKYQGKSMMSLNEMAKLAIDYEGDGYVTGYPIVSGDDAYILNGVIEANEEYITINQWVPVFPESLQPISPSLSDDQQVVLEWLKQYREEQGENPLNTVSTLIDMYCADPAGGEVPLPSNVKEAYKKLNDEQEFQVLAAFVEWGLSTLDN